MSSPAVAPVPFEPPAPTRAIGRVVSVTGFQAVILLDYQAARDARAELGTLLKIDTPKTMLLGLVSALSVPVPAQKDGEPEVRIAEVELMGELPKLPDGTLGAFLRGVSTYPGLGDAVHVATADALKRVYQLKSDQAVRVGTLLQDASIPAMVDVDGLLGKHCAVLGSTGTGKSRGVALMLRAILQKNPQAHILLLDPHNEYASSFGRAAEIITPSDLQLPFWFLTFEEMLEVVLGGQIAKDAEVDILAELIPAAKSRYAANRGRDQSAHRGHLPGPALYFHVRQPHRPGSDERDSRPYVPRARERQADRHPGADRRALGGHQCRGLRDLPHDLRLRALERGQRAHHAGLRGGAPLRAQRPVRRLRAHQARHRPRRQGGAQIWRLALRRQPAAVRARPHHPVPVQHHLRHAHDQRARPGDRQGGHLRRRRKPARLPAVARHPRSDCVRRGREPAGPHPLR